LFCLLVAWFGHINKNVNLKIAEQRGLMREAVSTSLAVSQAVDESVMNCDCVLTATFTRFTYS